MASVRDARVVTVLETGVGKLPLTPEDFFVLSRVDGVATADEVIASTGLGRAEAEEILRRLVDLGAVGMRETNARGTPSSRGGSLPGSRSGLRQSAQQRRLRMLRAQMDGARGSASSNERSPAPPTPVVDETPAPGSAADYPMVAADDARLEPSCALPVDTQRNTLALMDRLGDLDPFALLGITPVDDRKLVQRAYHFASRRFHPDRYFGRELGGFAPRLTSLFEAISEAYDSLLDNKRRATLVAAAVECENVKRAAATVRAGASATNLARPASEPGGGTVVQSREARATEHYERGVAERDGKRPGAAASLFRLAMELDPANSAYQTAWRSSLDEARQIRAARSFAAARRHVEVGQLAEAAHFFLDAAEADPTPVHLAEAAAALDQSDPHRARELAMRALDVMAKASGSKATSAGDRGRVHLCCAIAFLGGGQVHTARQQAQLAAELVVDDPRLEVLLNSPKLT